jgi:hypothetical protein
VFSYGRGTPVVSRGKGWCSRFMILVGLQVITLVWPQCLLTFEISFRESCLQGYLTYKEKLPPRTLP